MKATTPTAAPVPDEEFGGSKRTLHAWETALLGALCIGFTLFHLFVLNVYSLEPLLFRAIHVAWGGALGFMLYGATQRTATGVPPYLSQRYRGRGAASA